ncbi:MAG: hypothetical protein V3T41_05335 [bacterium]
MDAKVFRCILMTSVLWMMLLNPGCRKGGEESRGAAGYPPGTAVNEPPSVVALVSEEESGGLAVEPGCSLFWLEAEGVKRRAIADFENDVFTAAAANAGRDVIAVAGISYTWPSLTYFFRVYELRCEGESPYLKFAVEGAEYPFGSVIFSEYDDVFYVSVPASIAGEKTAARGAGVKAKGSGRVILAYDERKNVLKEVVTTRDFVGLKAAVDKRMLWVDIYQEPVTVFSVRRSAILDLDTGELSPTSYNSSDRRVPPLVYYSRSPGEKPPFVMKALVTFSGSSRAGPDLTLGDYVYYPVFFSVGESAFVFLECSPGEASPHIKVKPIETEGEYSYALPPLGPRKNYELLFVE